jgi:hypothetical protein
MMRIVEGMSTKGDGDAKYKRIMELLEQLKAQIEATDRKVAALEKAEERATARKVAALEKAEERGRGQAGGSGRKAVEDVTKPKNEAEVAETGGRNGREQGNNQQRSARPELQSAKISKTGPGPAELEGEGWYDTLTGERGRWPRLRKTEWRRRAL